MPTRQVESEHDEARHSSSENKRATAGAEPNHPAPDSPTQPEAATAQPRRSSRESERAEAGKDAAGVESPSADQMQGANGLPPDTNQDDAPNSDQDIDTAGTEADEQSPTGNLFLALTPSLQRG